MILATVLVAILAMALSLATWVLWYRSGWDDDRRQIDQLARRDRLR